jgi:hypothetical protein
MIAGDIEVKSVLNICGFLGNFYGRAIFIIYCGVNILVFGATNSNSPLLMASNICGWICLAFGVFLFILKFFAGSNSLLTQELDNYLEKHKGDPNAAAAATPTP